MIQSEYSLYLKIDNSIHLTTDYWLLKVHYKLFAAAPMTEWACVKKIDFITNYSFKINHVTFWFD